MGTRTATEEKKLNEAYHSLRSSRCLRTYIWAAETKVKPSDLPAAVQSAVKEQAKGATIVGASKEREHGQRTYEVETKLNGKGRDLTFAENGSLLEAEEEVDLNSIPTAGKEAIEKKAAG